MTARIGRAVCRLFTVLIVLCCLCDWRYVFYSGSSILAVARKHDDSSKRKRKSEKTVEREFDDVSAKNKKQKSKKLHKGTSSKPSAIDIEDNAKEERVPSAKSNDDPDMEEIVFDDVNAERRNTMKPEKGIVFSW